MLADRHLLQVEYREYQNLSDEQLVRKYQQTEDPDDEKAIWSELYQRYENQIIGSFYKKFYWFPNSELEDFYQSALAWALDKDILKKWEPGGLSVKNWLFKNLLDWIPVKTKVFRDWEKNQKVKGIKEVIPGGDRGLQDQLDEIEQKASEFINFALDDANSPFTSKSKEGRRRVLKALWKNYNKGVHLTNGEKAEEINLTKDSFSSRKKRALDDLIELVKDRNTSPGILACFSYYFNYRADALISRGKLFSEDVNNQNTD